MSADHNPISPFLQSAVDGFAFSGYQLVAKRGTRSLTLSGGRSSYWPNGAPVQKDSFFDIGSLTKVVVGLTGTLELIQSGKWRWEDPLAKCLPALKGSRFEAIRLEQLLSHSSGLTAWLPYYREQKQGQSVLEWLLSQSDRVVERPPGQKAVYSDLNYWLLHAMGSAHWGDLKTAWSQWRGKLGMDKSQFGPVAPAGAVATEYCLWRRRVLHGEVFDENTAAMNGVACHAGLFSTATELGRFCEQWLLAVKGKSKWLTPELAARVTQPSGQAPGSTWALGWDTRSPTGSSAGTRLSLKSFGHLGFTGTSLWVDPEAEGYVVLLTNRIHPRREDTRLRKIRPELHDRVAEWWQQGAG